MENELIYVSICFFFFIWFSYPHPTGYLRLLRSRERQPSRTYRTLPRLCPRDLNIFQIYQTEVFKNRWIWMSPWGRGNMYAWPFASVRRSSIGPCVELRKDTPKRPHVDRHIVPGMNSGDTNTLSQISSPWAKFMALHSLGHVFALVDLEGTRQELRDQKCGAPQCALTLSRASTLRRSLKKWSETPQTLRVFSVLGCMDSYDSNQILILQHLSRSTRLSYFCTAQISKIQQKIVKIFGGMKNFISFHSRFSMDFAICWRKIDKNLPEFHRNDQEMTKCLEI